MVGNRIGVRWALSILIPLFAMGCIPEFLSCQNDDVKGQVNEQTSPADSAPLMRSQKPERPVSGLDVRPEKSDEPAQGSKVASIRVMVNNIPIFDEEVRQACASQWLGKSSAEQIEIFNSTLNSLIEQEILMQDAITKLTAMGNKKAIEKIKEAASKEFDRHVKDSMKKAGVKSDEDFKALLGRQGLSLENMRHLVERSYLADQYLRSRIMPTVENQLTHPEILEYYQKHPEEFQVQDAVEWQDIFIDASKHATRDEARFFAQQVADKLKQNHDIAQLSKYDDGDSVYRKGLGFGSKRGEIQPSEAEAVLFNLKEGEVGPLVELESGFHIVRLVKRTFAGLMPFDEKAQMLIRNKLGNAIYARERKKLIADLKRKSQIEYSSAVP